MSLIALHGFLGLASDWDFILKVQAIPVIPSNSLWEWAKNFNRFAQKFAEPRLLLGYSMGARLAMHAILDHPTQWSGAIFVSGHTGLKSEEKKARLARDRAWAERFLKDPWDKLMSEWNGQAIFKNSVVIERVEQNYSRTHLAQALTAFSLGRQDNLHKSLKACSVPQLFLSGEHDLSYKASVIIPGAGHRAPWDQPKLFLTHLEEFRNAVAREHLARD